MAKGFWIRFGDTDPYGVVYYATYHRWAHQAVEDFLREKGLDPDRFFRDPDAGIGMPVVASEGIFKKPVRYPAFVVPSVRVEHVGESSITFAVSFLVNDILVAETKLTFVCIDKNWKKRPLPETFKRLGGGG